MKLSKSAVVVTSMLALVACREPEAPVNVLLVVLDSARADAVGSTEGSRTNHTPNLDRLAQDGVVFTEARTVSAWTLPAHASLFTGLFPSRHGAHWENLRLDSERWTLAELLAPTHQGAGFSENPHIVHALGFSQGFEHFGETWRRNQAG